LSFAFKVETTGSGQDDYDDKPTTITTPKRFKMCYVDMDTILFRCAKFMQDDYIEVTHIASGRVKEFKNKTSFGIRSGKIIELKPEDLREDKDGNPIKWLAWTNFDRKEKGLSTFSVEDFTIETKARLTKNHDSYEAALKNSMDTMGFNIGAIKKFMDSEDYLLCIGAGKGNYRDKECKDVIYKGNRDGKPIYFEELRDAFLAQYGKRVIQAVYCEAEDILQHVANIEYAKFGEDFSKWTICGAYIDKDVNMVYIPSFNYDDYAKGWRYPTKFECEITLASQTISGDPTDFITGLPSLPDKVKEVFGLSKRNGASKASAEKLLEDSMSIQELWKRVVYCYQQYYGFDKKYKFKSVHGEELEWCWLDYLQQCYVLVKMQNHPDVIPQIVEYLSLIGVEYNKEISYGDVVVDTKTLSCNLITCQTTLSSLEDCVSTYKSLNKGDLVSKLDKVSQLVSELKGNLSLLSN
jgi:hypothetical protein